MASTPNMGGGKPGAKGELGFQALQVGLRCPTSPQWDNPCRVVPDRGRRAVPRGGMALGRGKTRAGGVRHVPGPGMSLANCPFNSNNNSPNDMAPLSTR